MNNNTPSITPSLAPWLTVADGKAALRFYQHAFQATIRYRLEPVEAGFVVRLGLGNAEWWISEDKEKAAMPLGGESLRLILTVPDPAAILSRAVDAGATIIFPVGDEHGWRLGRLSDPFGLHWEIGHALDGH